MRRRMDARQQITPSEEAISSHRTFSPIARHNEAPNLLKRPGRRARVKRTGGHHASMPDRRAGHFMLYLMTYDAMTLA